MQVPGIREVSGCRGQGTGQRGRARDRRQGQGAAREPSGLLAPYWLTVVTECSRFETCGRPTARSWRWTTSRSASDRGELVAVLGPNGAGKTTTISIISGLVTPDRGEVQIGGASRCAVTPIPIKRQIGLVPQDVALYDELTARRQPPLLRGAVRPGRPRLSMRRSESVLAWSASPSAPGDRVGTFSGGMKRRLNLAAGSAARSRTSCCSTSRRSASIPRAATPSSTTSKTLKRRGKTLVYTTHYMEEAERLADRVVIIDRGRVVADDSVISLRGSLSASASVSLEEVFLSLTGRSLRD